MTTRSTARWTRIPQPTVVLSAENATESLPVDFPVTVSADRASNMEDRFEAGIVKPYESLWDAEESADTGGTNHKSSFSFNIKFRSLVLVAPSSFEDVPDRADIPDHWPQECHPWLESTWCVNSDHEKIQALSQEIREDANNVMTLIAGVKERASAIFASTQGQAKDLTAVEALTGRGSCTSSANVVAALLRACNIPARIAAGYPSWSGPLQTHYIVEAYVPGFGWYPIESTMCKSPWPNEYQVNVAIIPPKYESQELAGGRPTAAGGVPYLSLTEMPDIPSNIAVKGTINPAQNCDHVCKMVRKFPTDDDQWDAVYKIAQTRWQNWLASNPQPNEEGRLALSPNPETIAATSPAELIEELMP